MNIDRIKTLSSVFLVMIVIGIFVAILLFLDFKQNLEAQNEELVFKNQQLVSFQDKLLKEIGEKDSLLKIYKPESMVDTLVRSADPQNAKYKFGLYSIGMEEDINFASNYLEGRNFTIIDQRTYDSPPSWYTQDGPTIFYYDVKNLELAQEIKNDLEKALGLKFKLRIGAGKGVSESDKSTKLNIHLIGDA